jgi:hypothetical protein
MGSRIVNGVIVATIMVAAALMVGVTLDYHAGRTGVVRLVVSLVVLGVVAALLAASLKLSPRKRVNLALALASVLLTVYAAEAVLLLLSPVSTAQRAACMRTGEPFKCIAALKAGKPFDTRTKMEVVRDLNAAGVNAWPSILHSPLVAAYSDRKGEVLPLGGISRVPTVHCNESGAWVVYPSDEHGFNNPPGLYENPVDVVVLGDSFARGYCVGPDDNVAAVLRERYPRTMSLGVDDSGPLVALATLKEFAAPLRPRVALWLYFEGNDLYDMNREKNSPRLLRYLQPGYAQGLFSMQDEIDREMRAWVRAMAPPVPPAGGLEPRDRLLYRFLALAELRGRFSLLTRPRRQASHPYDEDLFRRVLERARDTVRSWDGTLVFVYLPSYQRLRGSGDAEPHRREVLDAVRDLGIPVVDLLEVFRSHDDPLSYFPFRLPGHYNEPGYRAVAEALRPAIDPRIDRPAGEMP